MSRSFAALLLLAFATALCAQDAAVPPLEGTVIRRLGNTHWRWAVELHDSAFSNQTDQSSIASPGIRPKSRRLRVTMVAPNSSAMAAMRRSFRFTFSFALTSCSNRVTPETVSGTNANLFHDTTNAVKNMAACSWSWGLRAVRASVDQPLICSSYVTEQTASKSMECPEIAATTRACPR
jgi:hypothetical protein